MYNVSTEFRRNLYNDNRKYLLYADVVLADGTILSLQNAQIWSNGYKIEDAVSGDNSFDIGSVIINKFTLTVNNIYDEYSEYDFTRAIVTAHIGMEVSTGIEKIRRGVFTVDEATYNGTSITLESLDNLQNLDKPYSLSKLQYPATIRTIMQDACSCCDLQMATAAFDNDSFVVDTRPDDESLTFRQVVLWCMQISCKWAKADEWGRLKIGWYDDVAYEGMGGLDGGSFDNGAPSYQSGDSFDGGNFADYNSGDSFDGGTFADQKKYHHIYSTSSTNICTDDVVITGVRVICEEEQEVTDESGAKSTQKVDVVYQSGTDGYVLAVSGNKLIQNGKGNDVATYLGQKLIGWRFRPFNLNCLSDPSIEAGDICIISDRKGNTYKSLITNTTFQLGNYQAVSCGAESPLRNSATRFSEATQVYQELRKNLNKNKTEWEKALENLSNRLENSGGLYTTIERQEDGSSVFYMHDKPLMEDSLVVWKMTRDAWGVSTDGGKTWNGGMTVDGEMIAKILQTIGLNADWIDSGSIVIKDPRNNVMFLADTATGEVRIVADSFVLRGKTIEELSQEANEAILDALAQDIQTQLDGKIETYNQTSDPSTAWTTTAAKEAHTGDLWYSASTKLTKRWTGTAWVTLEATDTVAQELAQSKKRVFITTPAPPYDVGDLWVGNSASDMKRCQTARTSGSYVSSDWIKAVKYTDDTVANSAFTLAEDAMNASINPAKYLTQLEVFNKLTNGGTVQGIYLQNGSIYINASYIQAGQFAADRIYGGTLKIGGYANQNGVLEVYDSSGVKVCTIDQNGADVIQGKIGGFSLKDGVLTAINGYNTFEIHTIGAIKSKYKGGGANRVLVIDDGQLNAYGNGEGSTTYARVSNGNISSVVNGVTRFISDASSTAVNQLFYLPNAYNSAITSTEYLVFGSGTDAHGYAGKVNRKSSSSRRYKDIGDDVGTAEVSGLYQLPVRYFKYKEGYLVEEDERNGVYMPGFIAEELEEILPIAVDHNENGDPEKWNTDIIIPCMMKMLQEQKEEFENYKKRTDERLTILEKMTGGEI